MSHPFDQITPEEIVRAGTIIKNAQGPMKLPIVEGDDWIINSMINLEPKKDIMVPLLRNGSDMSAIPRKSLVVVEIRNTRNNTSKAVKYIVNHKTYMIEKLVAEGDRKVSLSPDDIYQSEVIAKADPEVQRRLREEYNVTDLSKVNADVWTFGYNGEGPDDAPYNNNRVLNVYLYFRRDSDLDSAYAHPVGFIALIDLVKKKVEKLTDIPTQSGFKADLKTNFKIPDKKDNYLPELLNKDYYRKDIKPWLVSQPAGPSYTVKNKYEISWQKWNFRISFNYRTGLVLHYITYEDYEKVPGRDGDEERGKDVKPLNLKKVKREVLYQAGISEMVVPYGDPRPPYHRKSAFDMGEYGMGLNTNSLELGCDCIGDVHYFDFDYSDQQGNVKTIKKVVCLHEEDAGLLHKHTEFRTNKMFLVRSRRLVVSFIATVTNYEYLFYWYFYQDGTIAHEIKASGILSINLLAEKTMTEWGNVMFPLLNAQYHQHIFAARLDFMVDGLQNSAGMLDVVPEEGGLNSETNPYAHGFKTKCTVFKTAKEAMTDTDSKKSRVWLIMNERKINEYTKTPVAWKLAPTGAFGGLLAGQDSYIRARAGFAAHSFWAIPYKEDELYAAGFYINQSKGHEGLECWAARNENIKDKDIVVYHTFGLTHIPRVEDFPIMPTEGCGFVLKPYNFFYQNPGLDVCPPDKCYMQSSKERSTSKGEVCEECWWGERRTVSTISCEHKEQFL